MENGNQSVLRPPELKDGGGKALARVVLEAAAQLTPVTAMLSVVYGYTHPSQFDQDLQKFLKDVAAKLTDHDQQLQAVGQFLSSRARVGDAAIEVVIHLLRANTTGRCDPISLEQLVADLDHIERSKLEEAVAELKALGFVTYTNSLRIRMTGAAFVAFDKAATGRNTQADAVQIASLWLETAPLRNVFKLSEHLGWEPRRLNPALGALRDVFPEGRWSQEVHLTLETTSVIVTPEERFRLREIVDSGRVD